MIDAGPAGARAHLRAEVLAGVQRARLPRRGVHRGPGRRVRPDAPAGRRGRPALGGPPRRAGPPARRRWRPGRRRRTRSRPPADGTAPRTLVFEIGTEEMPPREARTARDQLRAGADRAAGRDPARARRVRVLATPRRLVAVVGTWPPARPTRARSSRGPKVAAAYDADGARPRRSRVSPGRRASRSTTLETRGRQRRTEHMVVRRSRKPGGAAPAVLARGAGEGRCRRCASAKNMRWNDPELAFTRPIRWLVALWGDEVVPVAVSSLPAGRETRVLRTAAEPVVTRRLGRDVHGDAGGRRHRRGPRGPARADRRPARQDLVYPDGGGSTWPARRALIDQITYLVEQPTPLLGTFDESYLALPDAVLTTVMRKHQRYLPVRDADGDAAADVRHRGERPGRRGAGPSRQRGGAARPLRGRGVLLPRRPADAARRHARAAGTG